MLFGLSPNPYFDLIVLANSFALSLKILSSHLNILYIKMIVFQVIFRLRRSDIIACGNSVIETLRFQCYFIRLLTVRRTIPLCISIISLRSNRTRRKANKTARLPYEKSRKHGFLFFSYLILKFS